jgi:hypothetical protein
MGLCSSSAADRSPKKGIANSNISGSLNNMMQPQMFDTATTTNQKRGDRRSSKQKLGFAVPQSLLQHENQNQQETMDGPTKAEIIKCFQKDDSGLAGFSMNQLTAICDAMTSVTITKNEMLCSSVEGIYYVVTGNLSAEQPVTYGAAGGSSPGIPAGCLFGVDSVFGASMSATSSEETKDGVGGGGGGGGGGTGGNKICCSSFSESTTVWHIHRQLFQAVLIQQTKSNDSKRSKVLSSIPMLAPLSSAQQRRVASVMIKKKFSMNETIIKQGEVGNTMYFIETGLVVVYQTTRGEADRKEVNRHGPGGFFGEGALVNKGIDGGVRNADCVSMNKSTICYLIKRRDFLRLLGPMVRVDEVLKCV